ncbi:sulfite exporter TauE/SafE family protein [Flavobacterium suncheonense]|uniref:Probable membrane transporter protein n=1 Tax=Flavobacterium suncheonense GH29-5 = DSM 17707 TaxID=1121899 RepID=A0A0A2M9Z4_9FLAO|nr:sulfite exporter TauE/SafE family protein [Flavobacterium suncheonense]KGO89497.1 permease [Flavobacterium suncheonense GH29-5 = DSM 17707]
MALSTLLMLMLIGLLAGMLSGLIGVGGGIIMVPLLLLMGFSQHQAQGTSLAVLVVPVTAVAVYNYYKEGYIDWRFAAVIAIFFVVGGYFGSKLAISVDQKILKKVFGVILLLIAGKMILGK